MTQCILAILVQMRVRAYIYSRFSINEVMDFSLRNQCVFELFKIGIVGQHRSALVSQSETCLQDAYAFEQ